jgi:hypothetical protein
MNKKIYFSIIAFSLVSFFTKGQVLTYKDVAGAFYKRPVAIMKEQTIFRLLTTLRPIVTKT